MAYFDDLAQKLALDVLKAKDAMGDEQLVQEIAETLEASSNTMHEAFMTAVRVYAAEERARTQLTAKLKAAGYALK
ncbi:hypothetical protein SAMN05444000_11921 [Shimia gijangensis]|uniref:Uncharacterized protein n=1 Tax=Shimia gijangensis TaxID=1470563 RepID=A0A1M6PRB9_9RHOB|nr:hypothetical protein [Shimia gijangensis]SHK10514.1 hypothetical protein SAMN05444000_11921 [Shimia gijangensis]